MKLSLKGARLVLFFFIFGLAVGYLVTMWSLFPTCYSNFIFATAPDNMPYGNESPAVSAHLALIHDISFLRTQNWRYRLWVCDAQGEVIGATEFTPGQVDGLFRLEHDGSLEWDDDAWAVTARVGDFVYRYELDKMGS